MEKCWYREASASAIGLPCVNQIQNETSPKFVCDAAFDHKTLKEGLDWLKYASKMCPVTRQPPPPWKGSMRCLETAWTETKGPFSSQDSYTSLKRKGRSKNEEFLLSPFSHDHSKGRAASHRGVPFWIGLWHLKRSRPSEHCPQVSAN